jgi:hypothetical protein
VREREREREIRLERERARERERPVCLKNTDRHHSRFEAAEEETYILGP